MRTKIVVVMFCNIVYYILIFAYFNDVIVLGLVSQVNYFFVWARAVIPRMSIRYSRRNGGEAVL
jgi:hypothetical protein